LSQQEDATLFMTLLAAFQTLLYRYTGQEDIVLCSPVAGRNQPETEGLIGYFNNILPLRTNLSGNPSFRELLSRVRQVAKGAYEHQDVPLQKIAQLPNLLRTPLTRGMFALQNAPSQALSLADIAVSSLDVHNGTANFDLSLFVEEKGETVTGLLDYKSDLFNDAAIAQMLKNFHTLLESIVANPDQSLDKLPSFTASTTYQLLEKNNHGSTNCPQGRQPTFLAPRDELELRLAKIWEKVLDLKPIGITDNFFSHLGGSSLLAAKLFAEIEKAFNKNLPLATLLQSPTIEQQANLLRQEEWSGSWSSLVPIQTGGSKPPLFCIHAVGGNVLTYVDMARHLGSDQPVYGLQAQGIDGKGVFHTTIEEMAAHYIKEILTFQSEGPYFLAGLSGGGIIAYEMAQQLVAQGQKVALLALFDAYNPDYLRARSLADAKYRKEHFTITGSIFFTWEWYRKILMQLNRVSRVLKHFLQLEPQQKLPYLLEKSKKVKESIQHKIELITYKLNPRPGRSLPYLLRESAATNALSKAILNYLPQVYSGNVTLFRASATLFISDDGSDSDQLGWEEFAAGGLEIHKIPGDHTSLVAEPHIRVLAPVLKTCIERALADEGDRTSRIKLSAVEMR
jgi:thioesterase domain-containing protein/acyl carrier protein